MSTTHNHANMLPRGTLIIAGAMVAFALAATSLVRITGTPPAASPVALRAEQKVAPLAERVLRFRDRADGAVVIDDVLSGRTASVIAPGEQTGFTRGVMRGLARDRHMRGIGAEPPFRLTAWANGQLSLTDTATGRTIELSSFGATNRATFETLLR